MEGRVKFFNEMSAAGRFQNAILFLRSLQDHPVGMALNRHLSMALPKSGTDGQCVRVYPHDIYPGEYRVELAVTPVKFRACNEAEAAVLAYTFDVTIEFYDRAPANNCPILIFERASVSRNPRLVRGGEGRPRAMVADAVFAVSGELGTAMEVNVTRQVAVGLPSSLDSLPPGDYRVIGATLDCQTQEDQTNENALRGELKVLLVPHGGPLPLGLQWDRSGVTEVAVIGPINLPEGQQRSYSLVFHNLAKDRIGRVTSVSFGDLLYDGWCPDSLRLSYDYLIVGDKKLQLLVARLLEDRTRKDLAEVKS